MYTGCYSCGQDGHRRSECPSRTPLPAEAPALTGAPARVPPPRPADQRAQYGDISPIAEQVRQQMGWALRESDAPALNLRAQAAEQVAESRAARANWPANHTLDAAPQPLQELQPLPQWAPLPGDPPALLDWLAAR